MKAVAIQQHADAGKGTSLSFRVRLTIALMFVVSTVTVLALYIAQRSVQATYQRGLQDEFQSRLGFMHGMESARQVAVSERSRLLARAPRISAALEENDVEDLYANARVELRDVLEEGGGQPEDRPARSPRATYFRFLNAGGALLLPPGVAAEPWEKNLAAVAIGPDFGQQIGYVTAKKISGGVDLCEVVTTTIINPDGELLGALVLGFPPADLVSKPEAGIKTGVWLDGELHMPALSAPERQALSTEIARAVRTPGGTDNNFVVHVRGEPHLLFYKVLNSGSRFAPAWEVCLYSLADSLKSQEQLRWKILGIAGCVLLAGLGASYIFSGRLSAPVEKLAEDSAQNLARREEAESALELTEQKYRSIFVNAVEGIFLLAPDGHCLSANPAMAHIFGYESPDRFVADVTHPSVQLYVAPGRCAEFLRTVATRDVVSSFECEMRRCDGAVIWVSQNARAVRDPEGVLQYIEGTLEDITERRKAADALRDLNMELNNALADLKTTQKQVIQQERLRALGQMASGIAHDFNNSLMPVMGFADLLLVSPGILDDKKKTTEYLETIRTAAKDAASIVARMREFYRTNEEGDVFAPVDVARLARQVVSLTRPKWKDQAQANGAEIRIVEELETVPRVMGDESALREVLMNLIFNAVDAMPRGGVIALRTRRDGAHAIIEVSDSGTGMSDEVRQRCMEPFFSTKGERGTGLGLAMVFGIVQRHEGTIDIQTQPGKGTTFVIRFPFDVAASGAAAVAGHQNAQQPLHVLVVDDEPQVRKVLTAFLENEGHSVRTAEQGVEGLQCFLDGKFDLVITDKAMPGMSGDQMAVAIKQFAPRMPIVLLSGFNSGGENEEIPGIDVIANKPITLQALREAIIKAMCAA